MESSSHTMRMDRFNQKLLWKRSGCWNFYEYYKNGEVAYTGNFLNGKRDGDWNRYTSEKELILTEVYKDGELIDVKQYLVDTDKLKDKIKDFFN